MESSLHYILRAVRSDGGEVCPLTLCHSLDTVVTADTHHFLTHDPQRYAAYFKVLTSVSAKYERHASVVSHCRGLHAHCLGTALAALECAACPALHAALATDTAATLREALRRSWDWAGVVRSCAHVMPPDVLGAVLSERVLGALRPCVRPEAAHHLLSLCDLVPRGHWVASLLDGLAGYLKDVGQTQRSDVLHHAGGVIAEACARHSLTSPVHDPVMCLSACLP